MKTQVNITEINETNLLFISKIARINDIDVSNKEKLINFSIETLSTFFQKLDSESIESLTNLKMKL